MMTEDFNKPHTWTMYALDHFLYFDEDHDCESDAMEEWTPVDPLHLVELVDRGLLKLDEVFSHRGWHHTLEEWNGKIKGTMWDGPLEVGEFRWSGNHNDNEWG
jgi:hypothetical protein